MRKGMCMKSNDQPKETIHKQTHRNVISSFTGKYAFLSNFYPAPVTYMGQTYANNEAAFQAQKTCCAKEQQQFSIFPPAQSGRSQKAWKRTSRCARTGIRLKISLMYEICMCKINYPGASTQALCSAPTSPLTALAFRSCSRRRAKAGYESLFVSILHIIE